MEIQHILLANSHKYNLLLTHLLVYEVGYRLQIHPKLNLLAVRKRHHTVIAVRPYVENLVERKTDKLRAAILYGQQLFQNRVSVMVQK